VLRDLGPRAYRVRAIEPHSLLTADATANPDEPVELVLARTDLLPAVAGMAGEGPGRPIASASVWVLCEVERILDADQVVRTGLCIRPAVRAGSDGAFALRDVPRDAWIHVEAPRHMPARVRPVALLEVELQRRCDVQVVDAAPGARAVRLRDAAGGVVPRLVFEPNTISTSVSLEPAPLRDGRSAVLTVAATATSIELIDGEGRVVGSVPLVLDATRLNEVSAAGYCTAARPAVRSPSSCRNAARRPTGTSSSTRTDAPYSDADGTRPSAASNPCTGPEHS
jgi:hypothetical protein